MTALRISALLSLSALALGLVAPTRASAQVVGGTGIDAASAVAVVVKVPTPWYYPKFAVVGKMRESIPIYEALPGLAYKAFSLAQADGHYGGIYLWKDESSARAWFGPGWFERVERERGVKAEVRFFEVPVAIDNIGAVSPEATRAVGTLVTVPTPAGVTKARLIEEFQAAIPLYQNVPGLLRKHFIVSDDGKFGGIYLWQDAASARQWFSDAWKERVVSRYGSAAAIEWFDTPILLRSKRADSKPAIPGL